MDKPRSVIRETDDEAIRLAKTLIRTARYGALATLDADDGWPLATRVGVATMSYGAPITLISGLSMHTKALLKDRRCALLLGEPGKGDPLAHPRITLVCEAVRLEHDVAEYIEARERYLRRHPKSKLYVGLGDFTFFKFETIKSTLNGGFGRAYHLSGQDLKNTGPGGMGIQAEEEIIDRLNFEIESHRQDGNAPPLESNGLKWRVVGVDCEGVDLLAGEQAKRITFATTVSTEESMIEVLREFEPFNIRGRKL